MHIARRLRLLVVLLLVLVPLGTLSLLATLDRQAAQDLFDQTLRRASSQYSTRAGLASREAQSKKTLSASQQALVDLGRQKNALRLRIAELLKTLGTAATATPVMIEAELRAVAAKQIQQQRLRSMLLRAQAFSAKESLGTDLGDTILHRLLSSPSRDRSLQREALTRAEEHLFLQLAVAEQSQQISVLRLRAAAGDAAAELPILQQQLASLEQQYLDAQRAADHAEQTIVVSDAELLVLKQQVARAHADVLRLQAQLSRFDARIRGKIERELIAKGLRSGHATGAADRAAGARQFAWPATGRISAGFHDPHYFAFFHMEHQGIDIVVPQGTPIVSAAEGIVFVVKDGGPEGYTYVLIGHRDGYATLYGHLSSVSVVPGREVTQGQVIGQSGGQPGTDGAGHMTTAPHLHFEVIQSAVNIDPISVLP
ncbi:peptidoglycan DD-metalloendopeptidase family protein [Candidatus Peregrinibacteria bacterium]|nr:peptidoglycan DD-metalloendopeptidase family protein [Candidatus Peregrinibacteria bacterium]MBI3816284.1 peptidoglycan DD-metalloendopeptidase family protein [Candidatus Peregrinibacteria bacterium]